MPLFNALITQKSDKTAVFVWQLLGLISLGFYTSHVYLGELSLQLTVYFPV